jgi:glycosyltransferase involved in cell wall biosynthesis
VKVALLTEGTYPQSFGGVSVWCDQLVQGLSEHQFDIYAIGVTGAEEVVWQVPPNVTTHPVALWPPNHRRPRPRRVRPGDELATAYRDLLCALLAPDDGDFADALRRVGRHGSGQTSLGRYGEAAARWVLGAWGDRRPAMSVLDALTTVDIIEHWLRPMLRPAPAAELTHAVTNGLATLLGLNAKWTHGTPMLLTEHGVYLRERYLGLRDSAYPWPVKVMLSAFQRLLCTAAYRTADLITPGNRFNHRWETRFGADPERIETVYNGVDPADFPAAGREPPVPTITWAGRIDPIKDLETLLRAFALVRAELPEAQLRIFGGTPSVSRVYHARCAALAEELGVDIATHFEGRVENIRDAYAAGHVVVLSSISEGFPYTLIEAMVSGRATVSTDVGGVSEAVGDTGLIVPPREPAAMAGACLRLLRDDLLRHRLGAAARERALGLFTVDKAVDSFDGIYRDLAAGIDRRNPIQGIAAVTALGSAHVTGQAIVAGRAAVIRRAIADEIFDYRRSA